MKLRELKKVDNDVVVEGELTVEKYKELKYEGFSDNAIMNDLGWHGNKMNEWKKKNSLIGMKFEKAEDEKENKNPSIPVENEEDWKSLYLNLKDEHELTKTKYGYAKKELLDLGKELDEYFSKAKAFELKYNSAIKDYEDLREEYKSEVDASEKEEYREEVFLKKEVKRLEKYEVEYNKLAGDFTTIESENKRLRTSLERLKHTEVMNLMMMERYLDLNKQMDEVL